MILMHACIYDAANFVTDERTNEQTNGQGDSRSWMMMMMITNFVIMMKEAAMVSIMGE